MKLKDEKYFKRKLDKLMSKDPIKFIYYLSTEKAKIAKHESNKNQQKFYTSLSLIAQKFLWKGNFRRIWGRIRETLLIIDTWQCIV